MEWIKLIWGTVTYVGAILVAAIMVSFKFPRKKKYWLRVLIGSFVILLLSHLYDQLIINAGLMNPLRLFLRNSNCLLVFAFTMLLLRFAHVCSNWQALFCVTAAYCMEHISQRLYLELAAVASPEFPLSAVLTIFVRTAVYVFVYYLAIRKMDIAMIEHGSKMQIIITLLVILSAIYLNSFANMEARGEKYAILRFYLSSYSIIAGVMGLFIEFYQIGYQNMKSERDLLKQLLYHEAEQYRRERDTMDVINVKYHDLKHQLHILERQFGKDSMKDMRQAIDGYDSYFHTGNAALDTVLTMKSYACLNKNIQLTCLADGGKLQFIAEQDIYSLFGNILDNAIEATEILPVENRLISLTVNEKNNFIFIHSENYYDIAPKFIDGIPQTTKNNRDYHGFGTRSLLMIAAKYNGSCTLRTMDNIFYTDIIMPMPAIE